MHEPGSGDRGADEAFTGSQRRPGGSEPLTRRERREAERRVADRRPDGVGAAPDAGWTGPERRGPDRRTGERRAALDAERRVTEPAEPMPVPVPLPPPPAPDPVPIRFAPPTAGPVPLPAVVPVPLPAAVPVPLPRRGAERPARRSAPPVPGRTSSPRRSRPVARRATSPGSRLLLRRRNDAAPVLAGTAAVVAALALAVGTAHDLADNDRTPVAAPPTATAAGTLLVGIGGPQGLLVAAVLGADAGAGVSLLLPGDVLVDDGTGLGPLTRAGVAAAGAAGSPPGLPGPTRATDPTGSSTGSSTSTGGPSEAMAVEVTARVGRALAVRVDGGWLLSPAGFAALVDATGGVVVDVDRSAGAELVGLPAGSRRLAGTEAASYATVLAGGEPTEARLARFQQVLGAVVAALPVDRVRLAGTLSGVSGVSGVPGVSGTSGVSGEAVGTVSADRVAALLDGVRAAGGGPAAGRIVPLRLVSGVDGVGGRALDTAAAQALVARVLPAAAVPAG